MKLQKSFFFIICGLSVLYADIFSKSGSDIVFKLSDYSIEQVLVNGTQYNKIDARQSRTTAEKGFPELPFYTYNVAISTEISLRDTEVVYIKSGKIIPSKGHFSRNTSPSSVEVKESLFYQKDEWYPKQNLVIKRYTMGKINGTTIQLFPFQYNPKKGLIRVIKRAVIEGVKQMSITKKSSALSEVYASTFKNVSLIEKRYTTVTDGNFMIIITPDKYKSYAEKLAEWKNARGISTKTYTFPDDFESNTSTAIKSKIQSLYDKDSLTYVLLLGDISDIPSQNRTDLWDSQSGPCDGDYVMLAGDDFYPDAFIGRLSVTDTSDARSQVDKILNYEINPDTQEWYAKAVGIASNEKAQALYDYEWMNQFKDTLMSYTYSYVDTLYDPSTTTSDLSNAVNEGRSLINYMGHGNITYWGTTYFSASDAKILTNYSKLPVVISVACLVGKFDASEQCLAEAWQSNKNGGSVAFFGSSFSQPWEPPQYAMQEMLSLIKSEKMTSIGAVMFNGEMKMLDGTISSSVSDASNSTALTWTLFGDPSMPIYTKTPETIEINVPFIDSGSQSVKLDFTTNIKGHYSFYNNTKGIMCSGAIDNTKSITAQLNSDFKDTITITITGINKKPLQKTFISGLITPIKTEFIKRDHKLKILTNQSALKIFSPEIKNYTVKIFDMQGRVIHKQLSNSSTGLCSIDNNFDSGIFFLKIEGNGLSIGKKITLIK